MKNLNKFTKSELIKHYKKLEEQNFNQTLFFKILNYIIYFKSLIIKITLIGFLIRWIKKYSLVTKLWHIFSAIGSTLLGFSLIDIYSWDIISWIKDTSIFKWYIDLFKSHKIEILDKDESKPSKNEFNIYERSSNSTNEIQTENNSSNRSDNRNINEKIDILSNEEFNSIEEKTNKPSYKKYFILGSLLVISGVVWYYFSDIRPAAGDAANTVIEKIRNFRQWFNNDSNNIVDNSTRNNSMNIPTNVNTPNINNNDIQLVDNNQPIASSSNILTSPSLENLNNQAESSWSEASSSSSSTISSPDSDRTVTQASISTSSKLMSNTWRGSLFPAVNDKINFIESNVNNSENNLEENLVDYFAFIVNEYNKEIELYKFCKNSSRFNLEEVNSIKEKLYYFREWIAEYQSKIFPESTVTIEIGSINDSPKILTDNIV